MMRRLGVLSAAAMTHRWHIALALIAVCAAGTAVAEDVASDAAVVVGPAAGRGSLQVFADDIARALQARAAEEGIAGGVRLALDDVRGLDGAKVKSSLLPRVRRALHGGKLEPKDNGPITATVAVSEEQGAVWAVIVLTGGGLSGPSTVVVDTAIDRELELSLGAVSRLATGRFVLERSGQLPSPVRQQNCAVLDVVLVDLDGDPANELAVLSRCGVSVYRLDESSGPVLVAGPWALPQRRWPRVALGWLASRTGQEVWLTTSAGHSVVLDVRTGKATDAPAERVPLRGVVSKDGPLALHWRYGSPVLSLPLMSPAGIDVVISGIPSRVRDLARLQAADAWVFIADDGTLGLRDDAGTIEAVAPERVGDRLLVIDIDGDGEQEIVTSSSASPGEPDQLVVRRLTPGLDASTVLLKSPLGGGSIAGFASGYVDFDSRLDVVIVEELQSGEATVWRLEHAP
jgi:hypothetical protein